MWTLILFYALQRLPLHESQTLAPGPAGLPAAAETVVAQETPPAASRLTIDEIAARSPIVADYVRQHRDALSELARLNKVYLPKHPRLLEAESRKKILCLRL